MPSSTEEQYLRRINDLHTFIERQGQMMKRQQVALDNARKRLARNTFAAGRIPQDTSKKDLRKGLIAVVQQRDKMEQDVKALQHALAWALQEIETGEGMSYDQIRTCQRIADARLLLPPKPTEEENNDG